MSRVSSSNVPIPFWDKMGRTGRMLVGTAIIVLIGFVGICYAAPLGIQYLWPIAGIWAAIGWGASRASMRPVLALILVGLMMDLSQGAPLGCWPAIQLIGYLVSSAFRTRTLTDTTGVFRALGDVAAFAATFFFAGWIIGGYLGGMATQDLLGNFLTTGLLYFPMRSFFLLTNDERVGL